MKLLDLKPEWLRCDSPRSFTHVPTMAEGDGIIFLCPKCWMDNGGRREGVHSVICWRPNVAQDVSPIPGRWDWQGTGFEDLTLVASSSSVELLGEGSCRAHFWIRNGEISFA